MIDLPVSDNSRETCTDKRIGSPSGSSSTNQVDEHENNPQVPDIELKHDKLMFPNADLCTDEVSSPDVKIQQEQPISICAGVLDMCNDSSKRSGNRSFVFEEENLVDTSHSRSQSGCSLSNIGLTEPP